MGRRGPAPLCPSHAPRRRVGPWRRVGQTLSMQDTYAQGRGEVAPWPRRRVPWGSEPGAGGGQRMAWGRAGAPRASGRPGPGKREEEARLLRLTSPSRPRSHGPGLLRPGRRPDASGAVPGGSGARCYRSLPLRCALAEARPGGGKTPSGRLRSRYLWLRRTQEAQRPQGKHAGGPFWTAAISPLELGETAFAKGFEAGLKLLAHVGSLKIGSATPQAAPVIFQELEEAACTPVP